MSFQGTTKNKRKLHLKKGIGGAGTRGHHTRMVNHPQTPKVQNKMHFTQVTALGYRHGLGRYNALVAQAPEREKP